MLVEERGEYLQYCRIGVSISTLHILSSTRFVRYIPPVASLLIQLLSKVFAALFPEISNNPSS